MSTPDIKAQIAEAAKVTTADIARIVGRRIGTVNHHIRRLIKQGYLDYSGTGRWSVEDAEFIANQCTRNARHKSY